MRTRRDVTVLVLTIVAFLNMQSALAGSSNAPLVDELNRLSAFIGRTLSAGDIGAIGSSDAKEPEVRALRAALLYRADPTRYGPAFEASFTVDDYDERARGRTTDLTQEQFVARIKEVETAYPTLKPQTQLLVAFVRDRNANLWVPMGGQQVSVARFFRGTFLAQVFKDSSLDALEVANALDQTARQQHEKGISRR